MKHSLKKKLALNGLVVFLLIVLLAITGQVCIFLLKSTSNKLVVEYNELEAIQEFEIALERTLNTINIYTINGDGRAPQIFDHRLNVVEEKLAKCENVITKKHNVEELLTFKKEVNVIRAHGNYLLTNKFKNLDEFEQIYSDLVHKIQLTVHSLNKLQIETNDEIEEYVIINKRAINHSIATMIGLVIIILIIVILGGFNLIKNITEPITNLMQVTHDIGEGNMNLKFQLKRDDEFKKLASNFNAMMEKLNNTTISRNYYDGIIKSMRDPLIVLDKEGNIKSINNATIYLLDYTRDELIGKNYLLLFDTRYKKAPQLKDLKRSKSFIQEYDLSAKSGLPIPVQISAARLKTPQEFTEAYILVIHDLTTQKHNERIIQNTQKERLLAINEAQESERQRIATDIHDGLGQSLTAISYSIEECLSENKELDQSVIRKIDTIQQQLDAAIKESKNIAHNLIPIILNDFGIVVALKHLIKELGEKTETKFHFNNYNFEDRISPKIEKTIYRICQEAINNILKHANAKNANIQLIRHDHSVVLVIDDDGSGFDYQKVSSMPKSRGIGLISMNERVKSYNGEFNLYSSDHGTEIVIELPIPKQYE